MATFESKYPIGDIVYLKTDKDQLPRMITGIQFRPEGQVIYDLSQGTSDSRHFEMELTEEKNFLFTLQ